MMKRAPLAARMRPTTLDEVIGQDHLVGPSGPLRKLIEADRMSSIILWGPPGTGKTTLAELIAVTTKREFERLSAVTAGVKDIREVIDMARRRLSIDDRATVVFVDEIHRFTTVQQDALLHAVEIGLITLVGATTENPAFSVNPALRSRSSVFGLKPVNAEAVEVLLKKAAVLEGFTADDSALEIIALRCTGDARQALTAFEVCCSLATDKHITLEHATTALDTSVSRLGRDDHYDVISAFIKSMRASEVDIALHWLARMVEAGEDPRFIARRMMIFASEDIGMADAAALPLLWQWLNHWSASDCQRLCINWLMVWCICRSRQRAAASQMRSIQQWKTFVLVIQARHLRRLRIHRHIDQLVSMIFGTTVGDMSGMSEPVQ